MVSLRDKINSLRSNQPAVDYLHLFSKLLTVVIILDLAVYFVIPSFSKSIKSIGRAVFEEKVLTLVDHLGSLSQDTFQVNFKTKSRSGDDIILLTEALISQEELYIDSLISSDIESMVKSGKSYLYYLVGRIIYRFDKEDGILVSYDLPASIPSDQPLRLSVYPVDEDWEILELWNEVSPGNQPQYMCLIDNEEIVLLSDWQCSYSNCNGPRLLKSLGDQEYLFVMESFKGDWGYYDIYYYNLKSKSSRLVLTSTGGNTAIQPALIGSTGKQLFTANRYWIPSSNTEDGLPGSYIYSSLQLLDVTTGQTTTLLSESEIPAKIINMASYENDEQVILSDNLYFNNYYLYDLSARRLSSQQQGYPDGSIDYWWNKSTYTEQRRVRTDYQNIKEHLRIEKIQSHSDTKIQTIRLDNGNQIISPDNEVIHLDLSFLTGLFSKIPQSPINYSQYLTPYSISALTKLSSTEILIEAVKEPINLNILPEAERHKVRNQSKETTRVGLYDFSTNDFYLVGANHTSNLVGVDESSKRVLVSYPLYYSYSGRKSTVENSGLNFRLFDLANESVEQQFIIAKDNHFWIRDLYIPTKNLYSQIVETLKKRQEWVTDSQERIKLISNSFIRPRQNSFLCQVDRCSFLLEVDPYVLKEVGEEYVPYPTVDVKISIAMDQYRVE